MIPDKIEEGGFQSAKTVIEAGDVGDGKLEAPRVALFRIAVDDGAARVRQSEDFGGLVEGFARRIVDGAANALHIEVVVHLKQQRVPTRHCETQERKIRYGLGFIFFLQKIRQNMRLQVINLYQGDVQRIGHSLCKRATHQQRTEQSGAVSEGDGG